MSTQILVPKVFNYFTGSAGCVMSITMAKLTIPLFMSITGWAAGIIVASFSAYNIYLDIKIKKDILKNKKNGE